MARVSYSNSQIGVVHNAELEMLAKNVCEFDTEKVWLSIWKSVHPALSSSRGVMEGPMKATDKGLVKSTSVVFRSIEPSEVLMMELER